MSNETSPIKATLNELTAVAYRGDSSVLLAFNLAAKPKNNFAGFAIKRTIPGAKPGFISNRLNFSQPVTSATTPAQRKWTPTNEAPIQKFRWLDVPPYLKAGDFTYEVTAMWFKPGGGLQPGDSVSLSFEMQPERYPAFELGFTRGYLSSQAYADRFHNAPIRPAGTKTIDFDTAPFRKQYEWLGFHARKMVFDFLKETLEDPALRLDVFAYDLDEPDLLRRLVKFGPRARFFLDNASLHTGPGAAEVAARALLEGAAGAINVKVGHFKRFAHNKVFIQRRGNEALKVLTGSANFSVRGLYVQANNVLRFDHPEVAALYAKAFDQAFNDPSKTQSGFPASDIARQWWKHSSAEGPSCRFAFSPHANSGLSLDEVGQAIQAADSSVLFAIMELGGAGPVLDTIRNLDGQKVFSCGVSQASKGLKFFKPGSKRGRFAPFAYLSGKVPQPFQAEWSGGAGKVVHHKFVVVDFNDSDPVVFTGSSNLAAGGEEANGDNLIAIADRGIAVAYGVEAMRLLDHYHFRVAMQNATKVEPLILKGPEDKPRWWAPYYRASDFKFNDRQLFAR